MRSTLLALAPRGALRPTARLLAGGSSTTSRSDVPQPYPKSAPAATAPSTTAPDPSSASGGYSTSSDIGTGNWSYPRPASTPFSEAHRTRVKILYKRWLKNERDWLVRRDIWREKAVQVRAEFDRNKNLRNPREIARVVDEAERKLEERLHPDPYITPTAPGGTKFERNLPPRLW